MFTFKLIQMLLNGGKANKKRPHHVPHRMKANEHVSPSPSASSSDSSENDPVPRTRRASSVDRGGASPPHRVRASSLDRGSRHNHQKGALPPALRPMSNFLMFGSYVMIVGILLTLCDYYCHVRFGVLKYTEIFPESSYFPEHPTVEVLKGFLGIGVFFVFGGTVFFGDKKSSIDRVLLSLVIFLVEYYCSGYFKESPMILHNTFMAFWVVQLMSYSSLKTMVPYCVLLAILGPLGEGYYTTTGFFHYTVPDLVYNTPIWLSSLYLNGGILAASSLCWVNNFKYHV